MLKPYHAQGSPAAAQEGRGWGLRTLVWSLAFPEYLGPHSPKSSCPTFVVSFQHLHLPIFLPHRQHSHIHMCARIHTCSQLPGSTNSRVFTCIRTQENLGSLSCLNSIKGLGFGRTLCI